MGRPNSIGCVASTQTPKAVGAFERWQMGGGHRYIVLASRSEYYGAQDAELLRPCYAEIESRCGITIIALERSACYF